MAVEISKKLCIGCGLCVNTCPVDALDLVEGYAVVDVEKCIDCGACVTVCPTKAIALDERKRPSEEAAINASAKGEKTQSARAINLPGELGEYRGVWVFIEQMEGEVAPVSWELLGEAQKLARHLDCEIAGILLGHEIDHLTEEVFKYGAHKVYLINDPILKYYQTQPYMKAVVDLANKYKPEIILMGATTLGRDLSGRVATELRTGLTADCTILDIDPEGRHLEQTRPAFGGNIMATILCKDRRPQMATVRPRVMDMPVPQEGRMGEIIRENLGMAPEQVMTEVVEYIRDQEAAVYLDKAELIVAGGRGAGGQKGWELLEELAKTIGATMGASRAAVEAGWIGVGHQVGQTGQTVRPKIYIAAGISGAIQHLVGMQTADKIIAINSDPEAPIFKVADYGLVGDLHEIIPAMTAEFKKGLAGRG